MREWTRMPFEWRIFAYSLIFATHSFNFLLHSECIPKIRADSCLRPECFWHVKNCRSAIEVANIERHSNGIERHSESIRNIPTAFERYATSVSVGSPDSSSNDSECISNAWRTLSFRIRRIQSKSLAVPGRREEGNFIKGICILIGLHPDAESKLCMYIANCSNDTYYRAYHTSRKVLLLCRKWSAIVAQYISICSTRIIISRIIVYR